jgi:hypothetical protein
MMRSIRYKSPGFGTWHTQQGVQHVKKHIDMARENKYQQCDLIKEACRLLWQQVGVARTFNALARSSAHLVSEPSGLNWSAMPSLAHR